MTLINSFEAEPGALRQQIVAGLRGEGQVWGLNADSAYALCADAFSIGGVAKVQELKGRKDLITPVLIGRDMTLAGLASHVTPEMRALAEAFWPGPLTFVVRPSSSLQWVGTSDAMSIRMPLDELTRSIAFDLGPMVAVGAARDGQPAPLTAEAGQELWPEGVESWVDSGPADPSRVSTVVDFRGALPNVMRLGCLDITALRTVVAGITMINTN